eukprot:3103644-Prymnesium_polylepis.1
MCIRDRPGSRWALSCFRPCSLPLFRPRWLAWKRRAVRLLREAQLQLQLRRQSESGGQRTWTLIVIYTTALP